MTFDVAIIGSGIAGASLAAQLAPVMKVLILEAEDQPGYHSTGRSNALWHETYGGPAVAPLTSASLKFLSDGGFLTQRSAITLARADGLGEVAAFEAGFAGSPIILERLDRTGIDAMIPGVMPGWDIGVHEANCFDIGVAELHAALLGSARRGGAQLATRARLMGARRSAGRWVIETTAGSFGASVMVNAAGGWGDEVAELSGVQPIGLQPYRRTITQIRLGREVNPRFPFIIDIGGTIYFRPEGHQRAWVSPHDETATAACDAAAEEFDVAIAVDRFQRIVDWPVAAVERSWAGLRTFAPDRLPVFGFDKDCPGFFWCVGQGGFGIQTAPAAAMLCAAMITDSPPDDRVAQIDAGAYAPRRFA